MGRILTFLGLKKHRPRSMPSVSSLMTDLLGRQHKTMFYTATVAPRRSRRRSTKDLNTKMRTQLNKWQVASSLSKSESVLSRTNNNSSHYYSLINFMDIDSDEEMT